MTSAALDIEVIGLEALEEDGPTAVEVRELCVLALASAGIADGHVAIEFVRFGEEDVVRHKLVRRIVAAYSEHSQRAAPELRPRAATPRA